MTIKEVLEKIKSELGKKLEPHGFVAEKKKPAHKRVNFISKEAENTYIFTAGIAFDFQGEGWLKLKNKTISQYYKKIDPEYDKDATAAGTQIEYFMAPSAHDGLFRINNDAVCFKFDKYKSESVMELIDQLYEIYFLQGFQLFKEGTDTIEKLEARANKNPLFKVNKRSLYFQSSMNQATIGVLTAYILEKPYLEEYMEGYTKYITENANLELSYTKFFFKTVEYVKQHM